MPGTEYFVTEEHMAYLDTLRASGKTNMFGAAPWVQGAFNLTPGHARKILKHWIKVRSREERPDAASKDRDTP
jgi:uncharacterized protein YciI